MTDDELRPTRRILFGGLGALGVAVALAGCGASGAGDSSTPKVSAGRELAKTGDVPVNGGMILTDVKIVLTQPSKGEFKAFSAICTHQGFTVTSVADDVIECDHHGSEFSASTGQVKRGPAPTALSTVAIKVSGSSILAA